MRVVLPQALHARPANLLVRLATRQSARIELRSGARTADARNILDVLALGAAEGEAIEIEASGEDAEDAVRAIVELVEGAFSPDLVPETGSAAVEGIAIGRAVLATGPEEATREPRDERAEEAARATAAIAYADEDLARLVAALPPDEAALFEPERTILRDAAARIEGEVFAGRSAEEAVRAALDGGATDLIADARARLLDALAGTAGALLAKVDAAGAGDLVLVTEEVTPSVVASLPKRVRGIVAGRDDGDDARGASTSHAAILARGRGIPIAFVPRHVTASVVDGDEILVDTLGSPARVWVAPSAALVEAGRARQSAVSVDRAASGPGLVTHLAVELWVNVGNLHEAVPAHARGIGLLRTELLFAARSAAPSEDEQYASLVAIARQAHGKPATVRLFDGGGDKPIVWLPARQDERGIALLAAHPAILAAQARAIARAARSESVRVLIPMCRSADDVRSVRSLLPSLEVGAMIETLEAAADAVAIAGVADFVSIGTNDLTARVLGGDRGDASRALHASVLRVLDSIVRAAHSCGRRVTVCGEVAADPRGAIILLGLGVDGLSVATSRFAGVARVLSAATLEECQSAARAALSEAP